jgi:hypothetical protein
MCYMPRPSHSRFDYPNNIRWWVQVIKFFLVILSVYCRSPFATHVQLFESIARVTFGEEYERRSCPLCNLLHCPASSSFSSVQRIYYCYWKTPRGTADIVQNGHRMACSPPPQPYFLRPVTGTADRLLSLHHPASPCAETVPISADRHPNITQIKKIIDSLSVADNTWFIFPQYFECTWQGYWTVSFRIYLQTLVKAVGLLAGYSKYFTAWF